MAEIPYIPITREIKIGVAKNSDQRHETVNAGIPGNVVLLDEYLVAKATTVETSIHAKFNQYRFTVKRAKRGAGATEFFRLKGHQIRDIKNTLFNRSERDMEWKRLVWSIIMTIVIYLFILYFL